MAITITVAAAKKLPHPTEQYGSLQATVSLQGEAGTLADAGSVMRDLFAAAQAGVDEHLAEQAGTAHPSGPSSTPSAAAASYQRPTYGPARHQAAPSSASRPPPPPRRGIPAATDSQIRLLRRLLGEDEARIADLCHEHHVTALADLDIKRASAAIDALKTSGAPS